MYYKATLYRKESIPISMGTVIVKKSILGVKEIMTNYSFYEKDDFIEHSNLFVSGLIRITDEDLNRYIDEFENSQFYSWYKTRKEKKEEIEKQNQRHKQMLKRTKKEERIENKKINNRVKEIRGTYKI